MPQGSGNSGDTKNHVVDFNEARAQKLEEKRRKTERIFFKHLLSVYSVADHSKLMPIELVDVSEEGCSFQVPFNAEHPWPKDNSDIPLRLYFSQDTYMEVRAKIQNSRPSIEEGARFVRFGCSIDKTISSYPVYLQFVRFLKLYSEHAHKDQGNGTLFYI
ncbi:MAG: PilZ domain-containing protein [Bdellovibrionota bacterium]